MGDLKVKLIIKSMLGALISIAICLTLYAVGSYDELILNNKPFVFAQIIGSVILGVVAMGGSVVYDFDRWSLTKVTIVHYVLTMGTFVLCCFFLGWFSHDILFIVFIIFTVAYFIIWLINYLIYRREIRRINRELENMLKKDGDSVE